MKTAWISLRICVVAVSILSLIMACSAHKAAPNASQQLWEASKAAGLEVSRDEIFAISRGDESFVTVPIAAWAQIPASQLQKGVNFAFSYFSTTVPNVPVGYYTLRVFADGSRLGTVAAKIQLIDQHGKVTAEIPAQVEIHSLTVPPNSRTTYVTTSGEISTEPAGQSIWVWHRCSNGQCVLIDILKPRVLF